MSHGIRTTALGVTALGLAVALSACTGDESNTPEPTSTPSTTTQVESDAAAEELGNYEVPDELVESMGTEDFNPDLLQEFVSKKLRDESIATVTPHMSSAGAGNLGLAGTLDQSTAPRLFWSALCLDEDSKDRPFSVLIRGADEQTVPQQNFADCDGRVHVFLTHLPANAGTWIQADMQTPGGALTALDFYVEE